MIDCTKKYKVVLTDEDGNVHKSDNVEIQDANVYFTGCEDFAEIKLVMWKLCTENAETPPEMPLAAVAAKATKIIQEEKRKKALEKEWVQLIDEVCKAVKKGESYIYVKSLWMEDEKRLIEMGYEVSKIDTDNGRVWKIRWAEPFYLS